MSATRVGDWEGEGASSSLTSGSTLMSMSMEVEDVVIERADKGVTVKDSSLGLRGAGDRSTASGLSEPRARVEPCIDSCFIGEVYTLNSTIGV